MITSVVKEKTVKPKVYLVSIGALPPGSENARGRLSLANIEILKKAAAEGKNIDGYSVTQSIATPDAPSAPVVTKGKVSTEKSVIEPAPLHYPEDTHKCFEVGTNVERSLREACRLCRCSVVGCWCEVPEIVNLSGTGNVKVYIKRVKEDDN